MKLVFYHNASMDLKRVLLPRTTSNHRRSIVLVKMLSSSFAGPSVKTFPSNLNCLLSNFVSSGTSGWERGIDGERDRYIHCSKPIHVFLFGTFFCFRVSAFSPIFEQKLKQIKFQSHAIAWHLRKQIRQLLDCCLKCNTSDVFLPVRRINKNNNNKIN